MNDSRNVPWLTGKLGHFADVRARIGWRGLSSSEYTDEGPFLIAGQHIRSGEVSWDECDHISDRRYTESWEISLQNGDIILTKDGTIGRVARIDCLPGRATINGTMMLVRCHRELDYRYLSSYLKGDSFQRLVEDRISGSSIPHIFQRDMVQLDLPIPTLAEQRRIADILDTADGAIQSTGRLIAKVEQAKQGLLQDVLTRGIDESGHLRNLDRLQESPHGLVPKEWAVGPLNRVLTRIDAGRSPDLPDRPARAGEWGVLKVSAIRPDGLQEAENKVVTSSSFMDPNLEVKHSDLLISRANTPALVGLACYVRDPRPGLMLSDKTLRLNTDSKLAVPEFIGYLLQSSSSRRQIETSGTGSSGSMKNISQDEIRSLVLALPGIEEQHRILASVESARVRLDTLRRDLSKLRLLKRGLMDDLLTGQVRVGASG